MSLALASLDILGAFLTLLSLALLAVLSYVAALLLDPTTSRRDPLGLALITGTIATIWRVVLGLALGSAGLLRFEVACAIEVLALLGLLRVARARVPPDNLWRPLAQLGSRTRAHLGEHAALALVALHAYGYEAMRGLLRPPLSWDSLGYHLLLTARWLQDHAITVPFGPQPTNYYGYVPANGSVWLWWWLAPSHSELYANLAYLPAVALLGLGTGAVARALGAAKRWPIASFLAVLTPVVLRYAATQYTDILVGASVVAACYFASRWLDENRSSDAFLAGASAGIAAGAKVMGAGYAFAFLLCLVPWLRGRSRRVPVLLLGLALTGSYFYVRNSALGVTPLASHCYEQMIGDPGVGRPFYQRTDNVWGMAREILHDGRLLESLLGAARSDAMELGVGPALALLVIGVVAFVAQVRRRPLAWLLLSQVAVQLVFWATIPVATAANLPSSLRFLDGAIALGWAATVVAAERSRLSTRATSLLALALALQSLLQLHAEMPLEVRQMVVAADLAVLAVLVSSRFRASLTERASVVAVVATALVLLAAAPLGRFRARDRTRALASEYTAHDTAASLFAPAWGWLDEHGGDGAVSVSIAPGNYFVYPAMGMRLERRAVYADIDARLLGQAAKYPGCDVRQHPDRATWLQQLSDLDIRWLHFGRSLILEFPIEAAWAAQARDDFRLVYDDPANRIYERREWSVAAVE